MNYLRKYTIWCQIYGLMAEMGKKEEISLSSKFEINKEKIYGNTKILFIQLNQMNTD